MRPAIILCLLLLVVAAGCGPLRRHEPFGSTRSAEARRAAPPVCRNCNVLMISLSNVSAEHMSLYGYQRVTTPHLDRWARDAIVFENAFTTTSWTLPVGTSLFTSLYPYTHGVIHREFENVLDERIITLPEILRAEGYRTVALTGGLDYHHQFSHMRGFEVAKEAKETRAAVYDGFESTLEQGTRWLAEHADEKFFLFLHGYDAHCPFDPPDHVRGLFSATPGEGITVDATLCLRGFRTSKNDTYFAQYFNDGMETVLLTGQDIAYLEDLYDEEIVSVDELVGGFLDQIDPALLERTVIIIFSDHGEMFARHGRFGRAGAERGTLYDDVAHIPWLMKIPRVEGRGVAGLVQIIDIMPTLLSVLDLPEPAQLQGTNVMPLATGERDESNPYVFAGSQFGGPQDSREWTIYPARSLNESVRSREWKLIHEVRLEGDIGEEETYELYHLADDPGELRNVAGQQPRMLAHLTRILEAWKQETTRAQIDNASEWSARAAAK